MKVVVKIGGSLLKEGAPGALLEDVGRLSRIHEVVLVHGGGETVTDIATRLGKAQRFVVSPEGIRSRYTDRDTAEIYAMVMSGLVGKRLVVALQHEKVSAVSISGLDGALLAGQRKRKLAWTRVSTVKRPTPKANSSVLPPESNVPRSGCQSWESSLRVK